jgi:hypothetical protein
MRVDGYQSSCQHSNVADPLKPETKVLFFFCDIKMFQVWWYMI